jgi:hypothetical protein
MAPVLSVTLPLRPKENRTWAGAVGSGSLTAAQQLAQAEILFDEADAALAATPPDFSTYQSKHAQARELVRLALAQVSG